jgi:hypothetical protein
VQIFEDCEHRLTFGWPLYLERYIKGEVGIDLFLKVRPSGGDAQDFVATLEYAGAPSNGAQETIGKILHVTGIDGRNPPGAVRRDERHKSVLVGQPEGVKLPEPLLPSMVWLHTLNQYLRLVGQPLYLAHTPWVEAILAWAGVEKDGEAHLARRIESCESELVNKVIERRAEIMNHIADDRAKPTGRLPQDFTPKHVVAGVRIYLANRSIRLALKKLPNFHLERIQVFMRPLYFEEWSFERRSAASHEVHSPYARQEDTKDANRLRNPGANAGRVLRESEEDRQAAEALNSEGPPEEAAPQTAPAHPSGGYSAKRIRLGSPEDA